MNIYKVEQGNIYEGAYQFFYYFKLEDAESKAEEIIKERLDYVIDRRKMGESLSYFTQPYKWQKKHKWLAEQDYLSIIEVEVK
jgi:hypothetical protein